ncbi:MAG TPA: SDR family oxidoreductase [Longimicrobium sp.]|nr:SDR family oxidoreductase [Longimicrobium sp.]
MERVALITGATGALGSVVAETFTADGWRIVTPVRRGTANLTHPTVAVVVADVSTEEGAAYAVERTMEWGGRLDAVVHTVGGYHGGAPLHETAVADWDGMMSANLRSAFLVARAAIPRMRDGGSLVFVSSRAALKGRKGNAAYAVSKAALLTLVEAIAEENRGRIRANAVLPGTIDTPDNRAAMPDAKHERWTPPAEIARVILFLASDASAPVSGAAVPVYGNS